MQCCSCNAVADMGASVLVKSILHAFQRVWKILQLLMAQASSKRAGTVSSSFSCVRFTNSVSFNDLSVGPPVLCSDSNPLNTESWFWTYYWCIAISNQHQVLVCPWCCIINCWSNEKNLTLWIFSPVCSLCYHICCECYQQVKLVHHIRDILQIFFAMKIKNQLLNWVVEIS